MNQTIVPNAVPKSLNPSSYSKAGVNRSHLASIESETQPNTSIKTVEKLATALGVALLDLLQSPEDR
jgi:hypothetical protein